MQVRCKVLNTKANMRIVCVMGICFVISVRIPPAPGLREEERCFRPIHYGPSADMSLWKSVACNWLPPVLTPKA